MKTKSPNGPARGAAHPAPVTPPTNERSSPTLDLGVALPKEWLAASGLALGATLDGRVLADGSLLLRVGPATEPVDVCAVEITSEIPIEHVFRQLVAAYLGGAEEFILVEPGGLGSSTIEIARTFAERTASPEIVFQGRDRIVLRIPPGRSAVSLPNEVRRMFQLSAGLQETAGEVLALVRPVDPSEMARRDDAIDRQAWLVERTLARRAARPPDGEPWGTGDDLPSWLLLARALERVGDHAVTLGLCGIQLAECSVPDGVRAAVRAYHRQVVEYLRSAYEVTETPEVDRANELLDLGEALHATHTALTESLLVRAGVGLSPLTSACVGLILQSIDRTAAYAQDIAEIGLDRAIAVRIALGPVDPAGRAAPLPRAPPLAAPSR